MRGDRGHAHRHQNYALGIRADDALGGLCELSDALRSGARVRMCTVHDGEPELGRLPLLRKSQISGLLAGCGKLVLTVNVAGHLGGATSKVLNVERCGGAGLRFQPGRGASTAFFLIVVSNFLQSRVQLQGDLGGTKPKSSSPQ